MHKDLSDEYRGWVSRLAADTAESLLYSGQGLAIAREVLISVFDKAAEELDAPA